MTPRTLRLLLIVAIPILLLILSSSYLFEWMWLNELGYSSVFWTIRGAQLALTIIAFVVACLYLIPNLRYLAERLRYASFTGTPLQNVNLNFSSESGRSEEHTSELQSRGHLVCRRLLEKKKIHVEK